MGSNMGDRAHYIFSAIQMIHKREDSEVTAVSSVYRTTPVDYDHQPDFFNVACGIKTHLSAYQLLDVTQSIEQLLDRDRKIRFGPRTIDIDILTYDKIIIQSDRLTIPHPRMHERAFVMIPLSEILSDLNMTSPLKGEVQRIGHLNELMWGRPDLNTE